MLARDVHLSIGAAERFSAATSLLTAMYKRAVLAAVLLALVACDPGFRVTVTRPVAEQIGRACVAQALRADSTFSVVDTAARPWLRGDTVAAIGDFRWREPDDVPWPQVGSLYRHAGVGSDTLIAAFGRLGVARPGEVQRAAAELRARVNAVVDQCARPLAPAHCEFSATGRGVAPCFTGGA
jgi:hypothetical protein